MRVVCLDYISLSHSAQLTVGKREGRALVHLQVILRATGTATGRNPRGRTTHVGSRTEEMEKAVAGNEDGWGQVI